MVEQPLLMRNPSVVLPLVMLIGLMIAGVTPMAVQYAGVSSQDAKPVQCCSTICSARMSNR
jgi:predicted metal-binding membrane protein